MFTIRKVLNDCKLTYNDVHCPLKRSRNAHSKEAKEEDNTDITKIMDVEICFPEIFAIVGHTYITDIVSFRVMFKNAQNIELANTIANYVAQNHNVVTQPKLHVNNSKGFVVPDRLEFLLNVGTSYDISVLFMHLNRFPIMYNEEHIL
jgi:hypothetical protein